MKNINKPAASKTAIYSAHGITYKTGKILSPIGFIPEFLKEGNSKTGKAVYTFSLLPGTKDYSVQIAGQETTVKGSCICNCTGCYAETGFFRMKSVIASLALNTYMINTFPDFVREAISAQLETIGRGEIRIHAAGDFNTADPDGYANMWHHIAKKYTTFRFWTYTKVKRFETMFDDLKNANIVKSVIPHIGVNFGHCDYIINVYYTLKAMGCKVYICRCGIDPEQHCERCGVCAAYDYVLFLEHSTAYKAENDPLFPALCEIVNNQ